MSIDFATKMMQLQSNMTPLLVPVCGTSFIVAIIIVVYRLRFAPLSRIPGPWITAITSWWIMLHEFKGDRTVTLDALHRQYGPIVRVSPGEVSFNSRPALKEIYGVGSTYSKSPFYEMFVYYDHRNTFTSVHKQEHSTRKKLVADRYTKSYVTKPIAADMIQRHAAVLMQRLQQQPVIDAYWWLHYYAIDAITTHVYGVYGTKTLEDEAHRDLVYDLSGIKHRTRLYSIFYFKDLMLLIEGIKRQYKWLRGEPTEFHVRGNRLNKYGIETVKSIGKDPESYGDSTAGKLYSVVPDSPNRIAAECMDHLVAGVDTTGDAMCVLMWRISTPEYQHVQEKLFAELLSVDGGFDPRSETVPITAVDKLPYLEAVILEGMRWRAPVPMSLFRMCPPEGRTVEGYHILGGTTVSCQAYSLHRIPEVFPDPDRYDPQRWLTDDKEKLSEMKALFWPFSSGARTCLGQNFAMVEMKTIFASVYRYYRTSAGAGCTEESMRMDDQLTSGVPFALKCELKFERRNDAVPRPLVEL